MILAAGEGTRLRPLTLDCPKPMLRVGDRPLLAHVVAWLRYHGVRDLVINLFYRGETVSDYFGDGSHFGVRLTYSAEERLLGTAGGVRRVAGRFDDTFVLVYGDVLTDLNLGALLAFHASRPERPRMTLSLYRVPNPTACGIVNLADDGRITRFVEKPKAPEVFSDLANAGVLVIDPELLQYIPDDQVFDFGHDLFPALLEAKRPMYGWPIPERTYLIDIGSPETYARVQREWPTAAARRFLEAGA